MAKPFRFRLETLLDVRRLKEDLAQGEFARAHGAVVSQNEKVGGLLREDEAGKTSLRETRKDALDLVQVRLHEGYLLALERRIRREMETLRDLSRTEGEKRRALTQAMKDVRVLERLRERQHGAWRTEEGREEQKFLDEVARNTKKAEEA